MHHCNILKCAILGTLMHSLRHPRNAASLAGFFVLLAAAFWAAQALSNVHVDFAGVTLLAGLGLATGLMAYVLVAGSPRD